MLHPSYTDLINVVNSDVEAGEHPVVQSRYSIVIATAKRARELIGGARPLVEGVEGEKPLSIAVKELYDGKIKIMQEDEEVDFDDDLMDMDNLDAIDEEVEESDAIDFEGESSEAGESADETEE